MCRATTNPLGVKGVGEAGTTASIAAVMNAVADAIPGGAGAHLDMPVTAMKLWEACRRAEQRLSRRRATSNILLVPSNSFGRQGPFIRARARFGRRTLENINEGDDDAVDLVVDRAIGPHAHVVPAAVAAADFAA